MTSLRQKAISGASWSLTGRILQQGTQFVVGIILARLLSPEEYGLVAMAFVFITVTYVFIDSGFGSAIIQRASLSNADLSTVFYLNLGVSILVYTLLYAFAKPISVFFNEPLLVDVVKVLSFIVILYALTIVQNSLIIRNVNFKLRTRIEVFSQVLSGAIAIYLATVGFGVWALVWKTILNQVLVNIQLWAVNNWFPSLEFSKKSFKELFSFSSKLLLAGIIDRIYSQMHRLVVGKFFPAAELGYFTRAEQFNNLPSQTISASLMSFLLPVFSKMQTEPERLKSAAKKVLKIVMFFNISAMLLLGVVAEPMIQVLLGERWLPTVPYLQLLVFVGVIYPVHLINVQILTSLGRSDLFLKIEILKKLVGVPTVLIGVFFGIKAMIVAMIAGSLVALMINTYYTQKLIKFGILEQLSSISKSFLIATIVSATVFFLSIVIKNHISQLSLLLLITGMAAPLLIILSMVFKLEEYYEIKTIIKGFVNKRK